MAGHVASDNSEALTKAENDDTATKPDDDEIVDLVSSGGQEAFTGRFALGAMVDPNGRM